jgi:hypothetical protein
MILARATHGRRKAQEEVGRVAVADETTRLTQLSIRYILAGI